MGGLISICVEDFKIAGVAVTARGMATLIKENDDDLALAMQEMATGVTIDNFEPRGFALLYLGQSAIAALARTGYAWEAMRIGGFISGAEDCMVCCMRRHHARVCDDEKCDADFSLWVEMAVEKALEAWKGLRDQ